MDAQIRRAREEDIPELSRLVAAIAAYHEALDTRIRHDWNAIRDAPSWLKIVLARDHHAVWVADRGAGCLVGYLWVHLRRSRQGALPPVTGYINHAFLEEGWRGKGLMRPMLDEAYQWLRAKEVTVVTLGVAHRNWLGSTAWYKFGFEDFSHERRMELKPLVRDE